MRKAKRIALLLERQERILKRQETFCELGANEARRVTALEARWRTLRDQVGELEAARQELCPHSAVVYKEWSRNWRQFEFQCEACHRSFYYTEAHLPARFRKILEASGVLQAKKGKK